MSTIRNPVEKPYVLEYTIPLSQLASGGAALSYDDRPWFFAARRHFV
ncbi:MAG: hypothetical protein ACKV19_16465 [Verrucomicrobiales bacterium]